MDVNVINAWIRKNRDKFGSEYEEVFVRNVFPVLDGFNIHDVVPQYPFVDLEGRQRYCDFLVKVNNFIIVIEIDGYDKRGVGSGMTHDEFVDWQRRQSAIAAMGWHVLRFANRDVRDNPKFCANVINSLILKLEGKNSEIKKNVDEGISKLPSVEINLNDGIDEIESDKDSFFVKKWFIFVLSLLFTLTFSLIFDHGTLKFQNLGANYVAEIFGASLVPYVLGFLVAFFARKIFKIDKYFFVSVWIIFQLCFSMLAPYQIIKKGKNIQEEKSLSFSESKELISDQNQSLEQKNPMLDMKSGAEKKEYAANLIKQGYVNKKVSHMVGSNIPKNAKYRGFILNLDPREEDIFVIAGDFLKAKSVYMKKFSKSMDYDAAHNLGVLYSKGLDGTIDLDIALYYFEISSDSPYRKWDADSNEIKKLRKILNASK